MTVHAPWWLQINTPIATFLIVLLGALLFALVKGGAPERRGAAVLVAMAIWQYSGSFFVPPKFIATDGISLVGDAIGLLGFTLIAVDAKRLWPIWASAFQLLSLGGHFARAVELDFHPMIYAWMRTLPTAGAIIALICGTAAHRARRRRLGVDRSWQDWARIEQAASIQRHLRHSRR